MLLGKPLTAAHHSFLYSHTPDIMNAVTFASTMIPVSRKQCINTHYLYLYCITYGHLTFFLLLQIQNLITVLIIFKKLYSLTFPYYACLSYLSSFPLLCMYCMYKHFQFKRNKMNKKIQSKITYHTSGVIQCHNNSNSHIIRCYMSFFSRHYQNPLNLP